MEGTEKPDEENPSQVGGELVTPEVGKEGPEQDIKGKVEVGDETGGDEEVKEQAEENGDEQKEVKDESDGEKNEEKEEKEGNPDDEVAGDDEDESDGGNEQNENDEEKQTDDQKVPETSGKKRSRKGRKSEAGQSDTPRPPGSDRPSRERKTVDRYISPETARVSVGKPVSIEKGRGTQLKDIPNVAFKLSKRKADENLQLLHTILFGKKAKVHSMKRNIGLFSGFVWIEKEQEKQRAKTKEKLDKCIKEKLLDFCDVLNISVNKATTKKEELSTKLLYFLESPHATTENLLAEKEKSKKRRSKGSASKSSGADGGALKKQKLDSESDKHSSGEDAKSESLQSEDDEHDDKAPVAESDTEENEADEIAGEDLDEPAKEDVDSKTKESTKEKTSSVKSKKTVHKESSSKASKSSAKSVEKSSVSLSKKRAAGAESRGTKKKRVEKDPDPGSKIASNKKKSDNTSSKKDKEDGHTSKKAKEDPSRDELHAEVVNILKEVDFNTATLSDILRQLGAHFGVDLMDRKREVKEIITEVIQSMSDDEEDEDDETEE